MTFDPAVPLATQSPALFPAQNQANMSVLNANIGRDHQFNNTPNAIPPTDDTGYHNLIHMTIQAPSGVLASTGRLYAKTASARVFPFYMDDTGQEYQLAGKASVIESPGYTTLPGGLIIQWGVTAASSAATTNVTFGLNPFPNAVFNVQLTPLHATASPGSSAGFWVSTAALTTAGFTLVNNTGHTYAFYWVALGN